MLQVILLIIAKILDIIYSSLIFDVDGATNNNTNNIFMESINDEDDSDGIKELIYSPTSNTSTSIEWNHSQPTGKLEDQVLLRKSSGTSTTSSDELLPNFHTPLSFHNHHEDNIPPILTIKQQNEDNSTKDIHEDQLSNKVDTSSDAVTTSPPLPIDPTAFIPPPLYKGNSLVELHKKLTEYEFPKKKPVESTTE